MDLNLGTLDFDSSVLTSAPSLEKGVTWPHKRVDDIPQAPEDGHVAELRDDQQQVVRQQVQNLAGNINAFGHFM